MSKRIQNFPPCFWGIELNNPIPMVFWFDKDSKAEQPEHYKKCSSAEEAWRLVAKATQNNISMFAVAWVAEDKQAEVINFSEVGRYEWLINSCSDKSKAIRKSIDRARNLVFKNGLPGFDIIAPTNKPATVPAIQVMNKESEIETVGVMFPDDNRVFTYTCKREHKTDGETADSYVKVRSKNGGVVIVPVVLCQKMTQTELNELATSLGYSCIKPVASDDVTDDELEQWVADNYVEPTEDFQAMKAAYGKGWEKDIPF